MKPLARERCTAPGCRRHVHAHALCVAHYRRSQRGQPLSELRARRERAGDVRRRVVLYLSPEASRYLHNAGPGFLERLVEERAAVAAKLYPQAEPVVVPEEFDLYPNPPEEPLP
jgi:hypothetical protein